MIVSELETIVSVREKVVSEPEQTSFGQR